METNVMEMFKAEENEQNLMGKYIAEVNERQENQDLQEII